MKTILTLLLAALALVTLAQPQKINYQAIALGSNGKPLKNTAVALRLSVLDSAANGTVLYTETQPVTTDAGGQFSVYLGTGTSTAGTFASLPWANGNDKFLKVEMDAQGGTNYQVMGTTQLVSVPYAMAAGTANVIEEGTIMKMKNGHIYRLDYPLGNGPVWNAVGGITQANITMDTIFSCSDSVWLYGNKLKSQEYQEWQVFFPSSQPSIFNSTNDSIQVLRSLAPDTIAFNYYIYPAGSYGIGGFSSDKVVVIFLPKLSQSNAGPDQLSLTGTTATFAANAPAAGETGIWTITTGSGATLNNANSPTATFTKGTDSAYTLVWTITGPCGSSRDTVNLLFPAPVGTACGQAVSYAGESYSTVQIGTQCWFAKNLNVGTMIQGANDQTNNSTLEKYCYNNDPANCTTYGGLYQWAEAVQYQNGASNTTSPTPGFTGNVRGICPTGWHLPSDAEYCTLTTFLDATVNCSFLGWSGTDAGGKMKLTSGLWTSPNTGATNSSGFSALPGGYRDTDGTFSIIGNSTFFLSSSEASTTSAFFRDLYYNYSNISRSDGNKIFGFSARCIMDSCSTTTSSAGPDQLSLTGTTATLAANTPAAGETGTWTITTGSGATLN